jgi:hypothetical protein
MQKNKKKLEWSREVTIYTFRKLTYSSNFKINSPQKNGKKYQKYFKNMASPEPKWSAEKNGLTSSTLPSTTTTGKNGN